MAYTVENSKQGHWTADSQEFPFLEAQRTAGNTKGPAGPSTAEVDRRPTGPPTPVLRNMDRGMRPAKNFQSVPRGNSNTRTRGVQKTIVTPLSALAENFIPRKTSRKQSTPQVPTDNELNRSFAKTGSKKIETPQDSIESDIATIGVAYPTEIEKPVAVADVAGASGPAVTGAGGPVVAGTRFLAVTDITGASGPTGTKAGGPVVAGTRFRTVTDVAEASGPAVTGAGGPVVTGTRFRAVTDVAVASGLTVSSAGGPVVAGTGFRAVTEVAGASCPVVTGSGSPVVAGTRFLAVAEVYAPFEETDGDLQGDIEEVDQNSKIPEEDTGFRPLEHSDVKKGGRSEDGRIMNDCTPRSGNSFPPVRAFGCCRRGRRQRWVKEEEPSRKFRKYTDPAPVRKASEEEPIEYSAHSGSPNEWNEPFNTDGTEDTEDGDAIMVGVVGSAAPWFLPGWTNDVEVEFMIDTGCQVTILATSVFEKMCKAHPQVKSRIRPCTQRPVSADSSPLTVVGRINLDVVFPVLKCNMCCVVASIGSDGLLGTPCSRAYHTSSICEQANYGQKAGRHCNYTNRNPPRTSGGCC